MSARRSPGEGSIFQDKNGRWVATIELPRRSDGRRHRKIRRARTRAEARRKLRELQVEVQELGLMAFNGRTVAEMLTSYEAVLAAGDPSKSDRQRNELFAKTILFFLGGQRKLDDISVPDCDRLLAQFASGEISPSGSPVSRDYCGRLRSFLSNAFQNEIRQGHIKHNPAFRALIPATTTKTRSKRSLTASEWSALMTAAPTLTKLVLELGGRHGLRPQELRALQWSTIDPVAETVTVETQLDSEDEFVDTKTTKSTRTIRLHPEALKLLELRKVEQHEQQRRAGSRWSGRGLILSTSVGTAIQRSNLQRLLTDLCEEVGVDRITAYELRHTAITHQIEAGHSASQVADWAGTSERMIYKHYRHKLRELSPMPPVDYEPPGSV